MGEILVVKFGGSVLGEGEDLRGAAESVRAEVEKGLAPLVVVSAMKGATDRLLSTARSISREIPLDELDEILAMGEIEAARLMALALTSVGLEAEVVSPSSGHWPIITDDTHGDAVLILDECRRRAKEGLLPLIAAGRVPVVCGFIGKTLGGKVTTLGRGGSDTTAVLLANVLGAREVVLVKDVAGFFSADPKKVGKARAIDSLDAEDAYILVSSGSQIIQDKALSYKADHTTIRIVPNGGSLTQGGTVIGGPISHLGVSAHHIPLSMLTLVGKAVSSPKLLASFIEMVEVNGCGTMLVTSEERAVTLYVEGDSSKFLNEIHDLAVGQGAAKGVSLFDGLGMVTVRGRGLERIPGLIRKVSDPLARRRINIYGISTVHSSIRVFVPWERSNEAVQVIRSSFRVS